MKRLAATFFFLALLVPLAALGQDASSQKSYDVEIEGQSFEIKANELKTVVLGSGQRLKIRVREKAIQTYRAGPYRFDYDAQFSLEDDQAEEGRQVMLMHATGVAVILTDHGPAADVSKGDLLTHLMDNLEESARRGVVRDFKKGKQERAVFEHAQGVSSGMNYLDEDGDRMVYLAYVLQSGTRILSIISTFDREDADVSRRLRSVVLGSVRAD